MEIILEKNRGYHWVSENNINFKGYFQRRNDAEVLKGIDAIQELKKIDGLDGLKDFLGSVEGVFSLVIDKNDYVLAAVDRARSMPLYYSNDCSFISDNAEIIREKLNIPKENVDVFTYNELAACYYIGGNKTVYGQIGQLDQGEVALFEDDSVKISYYFCHFNKVVQHTTEAIKELLSEVSLRAFERIKKVIAGRPVVLSLSGGYDSRYVGCMLKKIGVTNVSCYTYGKQDSFEVIQSKKNAEALGYRWICVDLTDELQKRNLDGVGKEYFDYYSGHDFTAYIQNFTAVRKLHEDGWFFPNSVFITGLCGDMPTGEYIIATDKDIIHNSETAAVKLYHDRFKRFIMPIEFESRWVKEMRQRIESMPLKIKDYQTWQSVVDCIQTSGEHSRWFLHMNTVHSFFGYEWILPYWDSELLKLWYSIPPEYKIGQALYEDWLLNDICKQYGLNQKKTIVTYSNNSMKRRIQYAVGGILNYVCLHIGIPFRRRQDYNNFAPFEQILFKAIQSKDLIVYRRAGLMQLLEHYLLEKRYGVENFRRFVHATKSTD